MTIIYPTDYRGYDGLLTVADVFKGDYEIFKTSLNDYMFFNEIGSLDKENDEALDKKIFNAFFNRYKNHFFRFRNGATIFNKLAKEFEGLYQEWNVAETFSSNDKLTGTTSITKDYKTNNGAENTITKYQIEESENYVDDSRLFIEQTNNSINRASFINSRLDGMKKLFMNRINESVIKEGVLTK